MLGVLDEREPVAVAAITICKGSKKTPRLRGAKWSINTSDVLISFRTSLRRSKGYAAHEKETLEGVVNARAKATACK